MRKWLRAPAAQAMREAVNREFAEQEEALLSALDDPALRNESPEELKTKLVTNQARREAMSDMIDIDTVIALMEKHAMIEQPEEVSNDV